MNRSVEMERYLQEYRINRIEQKREKLGKSADKLIESLKNGIDVLIHEQLTKQEEGTQGDVKYLIFCRLLSSEYTQSYEIALGMADDRLYLDENMAYIFWKPSIIYEEISHDMVEVTKILSQKYVRLERYELFHIQKKLFSDDWKLFIDFIPDLAYAYASQIIDSSLLLKEKIDVLYGGYMDKPEMVCELMIIDREANKWEVQRVHFI